MKTKSPPVKVRRKKGKIVYNFKPPSQRVIAEIAKVPAKVNAIKLERQVINKVSRGHTYEEISEDLGISTQEAFGLAKSAITKWVNETGLNLLEARELDLKRIDAIMVILWEQVEPKHPIIDGETGKTIIPQPNLGAIKLLMECIDKRGDILGYSAAKKMEVREKIEHLHRIYIGADPDDL